VRRLRVFTISLFVAVTAVTLSAQSTVPRFDTVNIRASNVTNPSVDVVNLDCVGRCAPGALDQGRVLFDRVTLLRIIAAAYGVKVTSVFGGPSWLATDRFSIYATTPASTPAETLQSMFQALLTERFGLAVHREEKPMPAYALAPGTGKPRLQAAADPGQPVCKNTTSPTPTGALMTVTCKSQTIAGLATVLNGYLPDAVTDATGIKGVYDFTLNFKPVGSLIRMDSDPRFDSSSDISIFDAAGKLGIKLERRLQPAPVLIVDHVNRQPSDDPGAAAKATTIPLEFEVVDVKPTEPGAPFQPDRYLPGGQVELHGWTLTRLIKLAYNIVDSDGLVGAPKWLNEDRFDILAKTSMARDELQQARAANGLTSVAPAMYAEMLQNLLEKRFKFAVHNEVRPVTVFAMSVAERGPKFKQSVASTRTQCRDTTGPGGPEVYTCQNITMEQFAPNLHAIAPVYLNHPVVDMTDLKGAYDLTLKRHWAPLTNWQGNRGESSSSASVASLASDPMGYITVFEAVEKQLGLKLVQQKHRMPVVVIDHIDRKPTEN